MTLMAPGHLDPSRSGDTRIEVVEPGLHIELVGRLDSRSAYDIRRALDQAIDDGAGDLLLDLRLAEIHDSAGLGVVVGIHRRAALAGRRLVIVHPSERFERLVRAARLGRVLHRIA